MKIESVRTISADPTRMNGTGAVSAANAQASPTKVKETAAQPQRPLQEEKRSADGIRRDIETINHQLESMNRSIRFSIDEKSKDIVVKVVDGNTGEVIKQLPPEEVLRLRERLIEMSGLLVEKQA